MSEEGKIQSVSILSACGGPADYAKLACAAGEKKAKQNYLKMFLLAVAAGAYIGLGGMCSVSFAKGLPNADVGLQRFAFGAVFPVGLIVVVLTGSELATGNFGVEFFSWLNKRITFLELIGAWVVVYFGNFLGSLGVAYFLAFLTNLYESDPFLTAVQGMAESKVNQNWGALVCLGIGCNWLVCLGVVLAMGAREMMSKILIIWFTIQSFVTIGFEHSVANMTLVTIGVLYGANVTFGGFILKNLIPVTIGNIIGAVLLVAVLEWYVFGIDRNVWNFDLRSQCCCSSKKDNAEDLSDEDHIQNAGKDDAEEREDENDEDEDEDEGVHSSVTRGGKPLQFHKLQSTSSFNGSRHHNHRISRSHSHHESHHHHSSSSHHHLHHDDDDDVNDEKEIEMTDAAH